MKSMGVAMCGVLCLGAVAGLAGCGDGGKGEGGLLRSSDDLFYYAVNSRDAARRLSSIMYNRADTSYAAERFKLVHISDPHLSGWSADNRFDRPNNLIESVAFANQPELRVNAMVETGDHISETSAGDARKWMISFFRFLYQDNRVPTFSCYGNHDSNIDRKENYIAANELGVNVHFYTNYPVRKPLLNRSYYYADVPNPQGGMMRFIALDMLDQPANEYNTLHQAVFSQEQVDWLGGVALREGMTAGHSVIILTHFPMQMSAWGGKSGGDGGGAAAPFYLYDADFVYTWRLIPEIVEAFRTRSLLKKDYPNRLYPDRQGVRADFDFTDVAGEFVCYLGGHIHAFALFDLQSLGSSLPPQKMVICTNQAPSESGSSRYNRVVRRERSMLSNSFNVYAIDTDEKKVYITFFGACIPSDDPSFPEILEFSYL